MIDLKSVFLALLAALAATAPIFTPALAQQPKPNILFILADNIGYGDIGAYGGGDLRGAPTPRNWTDYGNLNDLRYDQSKAVFLEQRAYGLNVWAEPLQHLRLPRLLNLRSDPFERAQHESGDYVRWYIDHAFLLVPAQAIVAQHIASFREIPPRQQPDSFSVEQAMEKLRLPPSTN